jgi:hypothetical protein
MLEWEDGGWWDVNESIYIGEEVDEIRRCR